MGARRGPPERDLADSLAYSGLRARVLSLLFIVGLISFDVSYWLGVLSKISQSASRFGARGGKETGREETA